MVAEYNSVYDDLAYFMAGLSPKKVIEYKASTKAQERVDFLLSKNRKEGLSKEEEAEIERYMTVEHIIRLAKAKALQKINVK